MKTETISYSTRLSENQQKKRIRAILKDKEELGVTLRDACETHGYAYSTFYTHRKNLGMKIFNNGTKRTYVKKNKQKVKQMLLNLEESTKKTDVNSNLLKEVIVEMCIAMFGKR